MKLYLNKIRRIWPLLKRYWQLEPERQRVLWRATFWLLVVRAALEGFPFRRVMEVVERRARSRLERLSEEPVSFSWDRGPAARIVWAIEAAGRRIMPKRPCLTQALVGRLLLAREGIDVALHIGVTKSEGELRAHAWLEHDDTIILGGTRSREEYRPFPALNG